MPQQTEIFIWHRELYLNQHKNNLGKINGNVVKFYHSNMIPMGQGETLMSEHMWISSIDTL